MFDTQSTSISVNRSDLPVLPPAWRWVQFSEVCDRVSVGHVGPTTKFFSDGPDSVRFLRSQNVRPGKLELENALSITPDFHKKLKKSQLRAGDILFVRVGANRGDCCVVPNDVGELNCANIVFARPKSPNGFHAYFFQSELGRNLLLSASVGAAQGVINTGSVASMPVPLPPLPIQRRIASILSAYDELIENNQRRIKILESMARALYREWFVHFRFPGHESVPRVASSLGEIPKGWLLPLTDHVDFKEGPGLRNWQYRDEGIPFLNIRTLIDNDIDFSKVQFLDQQEVESKYQHFLLSEYDHVVSSSGTIGRIVTIRAEHLPLMLNTSIIRMRPKGSRMGRWLLKHYMLSDYFQNQAKSFAVGAAQANFGPIHLKQMHIIAPDEEIASEYERLVAPMELQILALAPLIQNLRRTRDLLLPRLLSGQIDVEAMPS